MKLGTWKDISRWTRYASSLEGNRLHISPMCKSRSSDVYWLDGTRYKQFRNKQTNKPTQHREMHIMLIEVVRNTGNVRNAKGKFYGLGAFTILKKFQEWIKKLTMRL